MKKLSDYKGEEAIELMADIIEPMVALIGDAEVQKLAKAGEKAPVKYVKPMLKGHSKEVIEILARIEGEPVETYGEKVNPLTLPIQLLALINDPQVRSLFTLQGQTAVTSLASFGSATENTEAEGN